ISNDLERIDSGQFGFLAEGYADKQLLDLAWLLKNKKGHRVCMITSDLLMQVLCREHDIEYWFVEKESKSSKHPKGTVPEDLDIKLTPSESAKETNTILLPRSSDPSSLENNPK